MELSLWFLFIATFTSALAIPGANVGYAIAQSMNYGARFGVIASAGFAVASGLNLILVMAGLGLLISQFAHVFVYLKWVGVMYLLYLGYKAFTAPIANPQSQHEARKSHVFGFAVLVSLSNPKVVLMNLMLLPLFLDTSRPILWQGTIIVITGMVLSFLVYSAYALFASKLLSHVKTRTANKIVGTAYVGAALALTKVGK